MYYYQLEWIKDLEDRFGSAYDPSFIPVLYADWIDWEVSIWIYILEKDGHFYILKGGDNPGRSCPDTWDPELTSEEDALEEIMYLENAD